MLCIEWRQIAFRSTIGVGVLIGAILSTSHHVRSQDPISATLGVAGVAIGALTVDKIFDRIQQTISQAQAAAETSGNRLIGSAAEQSANMLSQIKVLLDDQRERTFDQLSNERKLAIWDLYTITNNLRNGIADDFAKDVVQVHKLVPQIAFFGKDVEFLIVRIGPPIIEKRKAVNEPIRIFGVGFGTGQAHKHYETTIQIDGKAVPAKQLALKEWGLELFLPAEVLEQTWSRTEAKRVPMVIRSTVKTPGGWWCKWYGCERARTYEATYHLVLYPTQPARLNVKQRREVEVATGDTAFGESSMGLPDMHNSGREAFSTLPIMGAEDGWRFEGWNGSNDGCQPLGTLNGCPFVAPRGCVLRSENKSAECSVSNTGPPVFWTVRVPKRRYEMKAVAVPDTLAEVSPGTTQRIEVDRGAVSAWIEGMLPSGEKIGPISLKPPGGKATDQVVCTGAGIVGDKSVFDCTMRDIW